MHRATTGYFSVIQYCPNRSRLEAANVGVLLFVPGAGYLKTRFATGNDRIRRFFSDEAGDLEQIKITKGMVAKRLEVEAPGLTELPALEHFLSLFANEIVFSRLRSVRVENPEAELNQLFKELVGGRRQRDPRATPPALSRLHSRFNMPDIAPKLRRDVPVKVPVLGKEFNADYAYQNGRLNLIQLKGFAQSRDCDWLNEVCKTAAEGRLLFLHPDADRGAQQLVIVGAFRETNDDRQNRVGELFKEHDVIFYPETKVDQLAQQIIQTAH